MPIRSDRAISLYVVQPLRRLFPEKQASVPILMYHRVPDVDDCSSHPYYCTSTAVSVFEQHVRCLKESGYKGVGVMEAARLAMTARRGEKWVAITFDDGYRDFYTNAFPVLSRYGYAATVFLPTAYIGSTPRRFKECECLTWSEVRELRRAGVEFGSHTVTHPQLCSVGTGQLERELRDSKHEIEQQLGEAVGTFAYPYAFPETEQDFVRRLEGILQEAGYGGGVSTVLGRAGRRDRPLFLKRLPVNTHDDTQFFQAKLNGDYDWMWRPQRCYKSMKSLFKERRSSNAAE